MTSNHRYPPPGGEGRAGEGHRLRRGRVCPFPVPDLPDAELIDRYTRDGRKPAGVVAALPARPAWHDAGLHSRRNRTLSSGFRGMAGADERLAVWRGVRDSGDLPAR